MTDWISEEEALVEMGIPPERKAELTNLRYRKKVRASKVCRGIVQYDLASLQAYKESKANLCVGTLNSSGGTILPIGLSTALLDMSDPDTRALARARQIVAKRSGSSRSGYSNGKNQG